MLLCKPKRVHLSGFCQLQLLLSICNYIAATRSVAHENDFLILLFLQFESYSLGKKDFILPQNLENVTWQESNFNKKKLSEWLLHSNAANEWHNLDFFFKRSDLLVLIFWSGNYKQLARYVYKMDSRVSVVIFCNS